MPKIIIIRGPLGVGKTAVSILLAKKLKAEYLSLDKILADNDLESRNGIPLKNFLKANKVISKLITGSKKLFIIDGCFYYQEQIDDLKKQFGKNLIIFSLMSDVKTCIKRDSQRKRVYGEDSARYVHMITSKIKAGYEIDNSDLFLEETAEKILKIVIG